MTLDMNESFCYNEGMATKMTLKDAKVPVTVRLNLEHRNRLVDEAHRQGLSLDKLISTTMEQKYPMKNGRK